LGRRSARRSSRSLSAYGHAAVPRDGPHAAPRWSAAPTQLTPRFERSHEKSGSPGEHRKAFSGRREVAAGRQGSSSRLKEETPSGWLSGGLRRISLCTAPDRPRETHQFYVANLFEPDEARILREKPRNSPTPEILRPDGRLWSALEIEATLKTREVDRQLLDERRDRFARGRVLRPRPNHEARGKEWSGARGRVFHAGGYRRHSRIRGGSSSRGPRRGVVRSRGGQD